MSGESSGGKFFGLLIALPFRIVGDLLQIRRGLSGRKSERQLELARASNGALMFIIAVKLIEWLADGKIPIPREIGIMLPFWVCVVLGFWGAVSFCIGASRARNLLYRDMELIWFAIVKIVIGVGVYVFQDHLTDIAIIGALVPLMALVVTYWCLITGIVQLALLWRAPPSPMKGDDDNDMPHGNAGFRKGFNNS